MNKWVKRALLAVPVLVALFFGAILIYVNFINDPDPKLDEDDLAAVFESPDTSAVEDSGETVAADPATTVLSSSPATTDSAATAASADAGTLDGTWTVDSSESTFGYRVEEVLSGVNTTATGRGSEIEGSITVAGPSVTDATFTIQVASITSDQSNRDNQFRGRVMETEEFPTATFTLTAPIEFGSVPASGEQIIASATGDLALHGVTNEVTFDVTAQTDGSTIAVLGNIPILFADYDIDNPSNNVVTTEDNGLLEFVLAFTPGESTSASASATTEAAGFRSRLHGTSSDTEPDTSAPGDATVECAEGVTTASSVETTTVSPGEGFDGDWAVTDESVFGYRVQEVLAGVDTTATGRSNEISGSITVDGTEITEGCFVVDVASITSDQSNRDNQFRGRVMETEEFPTATFVLNEPLELDELPGEGDQITAQATGELTLHGVTQSVTFEVTAQADADMIGVLGNIPIVFADYEIDNPSNNVVTTEDNGLLEFILVFEPA